MVFMNARKKNKTIIMFLVGLISVGLLLSVSMYFIGADYSTPSNAAGVDPNTKLGAALQNFSQGGTLKQQGKTEEAIKKLTAAKVGFEEVLKTDSKNYQVLGDLATTYFYLGDADKAIETVKKALEISPSFTTARMNYAIYLAYGKNNPTEAIKELEKIKKGDFNYDEARQRIGEISKMSSQPLLPPNGNNVSAPANQDSSSAPAKQDAPASTGVDPTTGKSTIEEGAELPANHPKF